MKKDTAIADWKTLPIEAIQYFDNSSECVLMQVLWFKSNLQHYVINLSSLNQDSPIKHRGTLLEVLARIVAKGWIKKTPIGASGKHHKYSLDKEAFIIWLENARSKKSGKQTIKKSGKQTVRKSENQTSESLESRPKEVWKADCIDNTKIISTDKKIEKELDNPFESLEKDLKKATPNPLYNEIGKPYSHVPKKKQRKTSGEVSLVIPSIGSQTVPDELKGFNPDA